MFFKNIFLSIINRKKDSIALIAIFSFLIAIVLVFYGFSQSSENLTKRIDANVEITLEAKMSLPLDVDDKTYMYKVQLWKKASDELQSDTWHSSSILSAKLLLLGFEERIEIYSYDDCFLAEGNRIIQGRTIENRNEILVKDDFVFNNRAMMVGDVVELINSNGEKVVLEVVGKFKSPEKQSPLDNDKLYFLDNIDFIMDENQLLAFADLQDELSVSKMLNYIYGLDNKVLFEEQLDSLLNEFEQGEYIIEVDDELANKLKAPIDNTTSLYQVLAVIFFVLIGLLLTYMLFFLVKSRLREYAIWLALGQNKFSVIIKFWFEIATLLSIAFLLCIPSSKLIFEQINQTMISSNQKLQTQILRLTDSDDKMPMVESDAYLANLDIHDHLIIYGFLLVITFIVSFVAFIPVISKRPVKLLKL